MFVVCPPINSPRSSRFVLDRCLISSGFFSFFFPLSFFVSVLLLVFVVILFCLVLFRFFFLSSGECYAVMFLTSVCVLFSFPLFRRYSVVLSRPAGRFVCTAQRLGEYVSRAQNK